MSADTYYAVSVANSGRRSLRWSEPFAAASDAKDHALDLLHDGKATLAFVVVRDGKDGSRRVVKAYPQTYARQLGHFLDLLDAIDAPCRAAFLGR